MYHSKVVILCWAFVYASAVVVAIARRRWIAVRYILIGAAIVAAGIFSSILLNSTAGAFTLSLALLVASYFTLKGIIEIFSKS